MPLTFTPVKGSEWEAGRLRGRTYDVQFDATYPAAGEPMTPDDVGLLSVLGCHWIGTQLAAGGNATIAAIPVLNTNNGFLQLFQTGAAVSSPLAEVDTDNLSTLLFRIMFYGF